MSTGVSMSACMQQVNLPLTETKIKIKIQPYKKNCFFPLIIRQFVFVVTGSWVSALKIFWVWFYDSMSMNSTKKLKAAVLCLLSMLSVQIAVAQPPLQHARFPDKCQQDLTFFSPCHRYVIETAKEQSNVKSLKLAESQFYSHHAKSILTFHTLCALYPQNNSLCLHRN